MSEFKQEIKPVRSFQISRRRMLRASAISVPMLLAMAGKAPGAFANQASAASMLNGSIAGEDAIGVYAQNQVDGQQNQLYNQFSGLNCVHTNNYSRGGKAIVWADDGFLLQDGATVNFNDDGTITAAPNQDNFFVKYIITCTYNVSDGTETLNDSVVYIVALRVDGKWIVYSQDKPFPTGITAPYTVESVASGTIPTALTIDTSKWTTVTTNTISIVTAPTSLSQSIFPEYQDYYTPFL